MINARPVDSVAGRASSLRDQPIGVPLVAWRFDEPPQPSASAQFSLSAKGRNNLQGKLRRVWGVHSREVGEPREFASRITGCEIDTVANLTDEQLRFLIGDLEARAQPDGDPRDELDDEEGFFWAT